MIIDRRALAFLVAITVVWGVMVAVLLFDIGWIA